MKKLLFLSAFAIVSTISVFAQIPTSGLVGYWPFSGNANDASGNGNNGTVNGATLVNDRFGNTNSAYHFDGVSQFIEVPHSNSLVINQNAISISFWIKVESFPPGNFGKIVISKQFGSGASQSGYNVYQNGQTQLVLQTGNGGLGYLSVPSNVNNYNSFHHVVYIFEANSTSYTFLDGQLVSGFQNGTASIGPNTQPLLFGKPNWNNINAQYFNGILDDVLIYNRLLTPSEINAIYNYNSCTGVPISSISAIGNTTFCQGSNVLLNVNENYISYQWQRNNASISGATAKSYTANTGGNYRCIVTSSCGIDTSNAITLTSLQNVANKVVSTGATSFCIGDSAILNSSNVTVGYTYQWYRNNIAINGATDKTFIGKNPGTYKVVSRNSANSCSRISPNSAIVAVSCRTFNREAFIGNVEPIKDVLVYPNPNEGSFMVEVNNENIEDGIAHYQVMNVTGQVIYSGKGTFSNGIMKEEINIERNFSKGLYILKVQINGIEMTEKVMLQ